MTVHGAKGLEAPIVILADTTTPPQGWHPPKLLPLPPDKPTPDAATPLVWAGAKANDVGPMAAARQAALDEARDEYRRLLYVAMTRATERLIVCGVEGDNKIPEGCWYQLVDGALRDACSERGRRRRRRRSAALSQRRSAATPRRSRHRRKEPSVRNGAAALAHAQRQGRPTRSAPITPSSAAGDDSAPRHCRRRQRDGAAARLAGAPADAIAAGYSRRAPRQGGGGLSRPRRQGLERAEARAESGRAVMRVLDDPRFCELFAAGSRAEVPIVGRVSVNGKSCACPARSTAWW